MKGCGDHLVEMGERGSGTRQAVSAWIWSPGPWIRSPGQLEETAHNGRVRLNPSNRPAGESQPPCLLEPVTAEVCNSQASTPPPPRRCPFAGAIA